MSDQPGNRQCPACNEKAIHIILYPNDGQYEPAESKGWREGGGKGEIHQRFRDSEIQRDGTKEKSRANIEREKGEKS